MVLQTKLQNFRTLGDAHFSLMRSLLGDFSFDELRQADPYMGPLFFVMFVGLAIFVILNMLIAIISDSYSVCREEMQAKPKVDLVREVRQYVTAVVLDLPIVGTMLKESQKAAAKGAKAALLQTQKSFKSVHGVVGIVQKSHAVFTRSLKKQRIAIGDAELLGAVDQNGDSIITQSEINDLDIDGNGVVTREELESSAHKHQILAVMAEPQPRVQQGRPAEAGPDELSSEPLVQPGAGLESMAGAPVHAAGTAWGSAGAARAPGARQQVLQAAAGQLAAVQDLLRLADMLGDDTDTVTGFAAEVTVSPLVTTDTDTAPPITAEVTRGSNRRSPRGGGGAAPASADVLAVAQARKLLARVMGVLVPGSECECECECECGGVNASAAGEALTCVEL